MYILLSDIIKIGASLVYSLILGYDREKADKPCGLRTIVFICLGATLTVIFTFKLHKFNVDFDAIRAIAYYLVAIGFVGGGIITHKRNEIDGVTTASLLLPVAIIGFFCGIGELILAGIITLLCFGILKFKYVTNKLEARNEEKK